MSELAARGAARRGDTARGGGLVADSEIANSSFGIEFNFAAHNRELRINRIIFYRLA